MNQISCGIIYLFSNEERIPNRAWPPFGGGGNVHIVRLLEDCIIFSNQRTLRAGRTSNDAAYAGYYSTAI